LPFRGLAADTAGSISDDVNLVAFAESLDGGIARHISVHSAAMTIFFLPSSGPSPRCEDPPRFDERAVNRLLVGKDVLKRFEDGSHPAVRGPWLKKRWHVEDLRRLARPTNVVDDRLCVMTAQAGELNA